jgi:glucan phosphoethanolaminetransferase (alkaline phosphatase superfamily)
MLKESNQSFSLVYFSDHAQSIIKSTKDNNTYTIGRIFNDLQVYEVPFILISSDIKSTKKYTVLRSGLRFVDFFANWIGVETNITDNKFDIFKSKADKNIKAISFQGKVVDYKDMHYITK